MTLKDLNLKRKYDIEDEKLNSFYIPALKESKLYWRLAGYFSSNSISKAALGIRTLIENNGTMRLITGVELQADDVKAIKEGTLQTEQAIEKELSAAMEKLNKDDYTLQPAKVLGWMLKNNILEIKIAHVTGIGIFHPKTGIFFDAANPDEANSISFSGSENETARAWEKNAEEFKVFKKWQPVEEEYYDGDLAEFNNLWYNRASICTVFDFPDAVKRKLIEIAPPDYEGVKRLDLGYDDGTASQSKPKLPPLWQQQRLAIGAWYNPPKWQENLASNQTDEAKILSDFLKKQSSVQPVTQNRAFQGILSMATASGKTRAAVAAAVQATKNVITIIAMPSQIRQQWENEIKLWDSTAKIIYGGGDGSNWRDLLPNQLGVYRLGRDPSADMQRTFVLCTYDTIGMDDFVGLFEGIPSRFVQVIGDEVHHFAGQVANAFNIQADRVLGLSATHTRHWDDPGTAEIERHFGKPVYEFDIQDGIINNYLCHYNYHIHFVDMTSNELGDYTNLSGKIGFKKDQIKKARRAGQPVSVLKGELQILYNQRAKILREADNKPEAVGEILLNFFSGNQEKAIIFCEDTEQVDKIRQILQSQNKLSTEISNRLKSETKKAALKEFKETVASRFLLGINMLDEGLDVPESDKCIIVASTTNPRQFIQRRGRVLRISTTNPNKVAEVHDTIVVPNYSVPGGQLSKDQEKEAERMAKIINKEIIRLHQMMNAADNKAAVTADLSNWIQRHRLQDYVTS